MTRASRDEVLSTRLGTHKVIAVRHPWGRVLPVVVCALLAVGVAVAVPAVAATPTITSFSPTSAKLGSAVTITGTGFVAPVTVKFAGTTASAAVVSSTQLTAYVPLAAGSGPITVSTSGGTATSTGSFTVTPGVLLSPAVGPPTATRYVYFSGLAAYEAVDVYFDTTDLVLGATSASGAGYVTLTIPADASPGTHYVSAIGRRSGYASQTAFTVRTDWPQDGYDNRQTATNPYENTLTAANVGDLREAWRDPLLSTSGRDEGTPAVVAGVVYAITDTGQISAYTEATGAIRWNRSFGTHFYLSPTVAGGVVYLGDLSGNVYALDAATGITKWVHTGVLGDSNAVVSGNVVYIGAYDDNEYALNASTGAMVWTYATDGIVNESAVVSGVDYVSSHDGKLYALNAATGTLLWTTTLSSLTYSTPTVVNGRIYIGDQAGDLYSLNAANGIILWDFSIGGTASNLNFNTPVVGGTVFAAADNGTLYGVSVSTGALQWANTLGSTLVEGDTVIANDLVYANYVDRVYVLTTYGSVVGTIEAGGSDGGAVVANGAVTILDRDEGLVHYTLQGDRAPAVVARPAVSALRPNRALRLHPPVSSTIR